MSDDDTIWDEVAKAVKPLKGRTLKKTDMLLKPKRQPVRIREETRQIQGKPVPQASPPPLRTIRRLKRQKIAIQRRLDLHGFTLARAHASVTEFICSAYDQELRCVEIITGRGNSEKGTGQLRRHVPIWLKEDKSVASYIVHVDENPASRGGSFLVLLRRRKSMA